MSFDEKGFILLFGLTPRQLESRFAKSPTVYFILRKRLMWKRTKVALLQFHYSSRPLLVIRTQYETAKWSWIFFRCAGFPCGRCSYWKTINEVGRVIGRAGFIERQMGSRLLDFTLIVSVPRFVCSGYFLLPLFNVNKVPLGRWVRVRAVARAM